MLRAALLHQRDPQRLVHPRFSRTPLSLSPCLPWRHSQLQALLVCPSLWRRCGGWLLARAGAAAQEEERGGGEGQLRRAQGLWGGVVQGQGGQDTRQPRPSLRCGLRAPLQQLLRSLRQMPLSTLSCAHH
jgi:hypothetical protein